MLLPEEVSHVTAIGERLVTLEDEHGDEKDNRQRTRPTSEKLGAAGEVGLYPQCGPPQQKAVIRLLGNVARIGPRPLVGWRPSRGMALGLPLDSLWG